MTDDKQNAQQWAKDAAQEIRELCISRLDPANCRTDFMSDVAAIIDRHMAQRDLAVSEAVRDAMINRFEDRIDEWRKANSLETTAILEQHCSHLTRIDLSSIIASVTGSAPERCVWKYGSDDIETACGVRLENPSAKWRGVFGTFTNCPFNKCGKPIKVKETDDVTEE